MTAPSFHESLARQDRVQAPAERSFGYTFAVVFALAAGFLLWRGAAAGWSIGLLAGSVLFAATASARPGLLRPLNYAWFLVGLALHRIMNPIMMGALFFLVITPFAIVMRVAGRDIGMRGFDPNATSYWKRREPPGPDPATMPRQY